MVSEWCAYWPFPFFRFYCCEYFLFISVTIPLCNDTVLTVGSYNTTAITAKFVMFLKICWFSTAGLELLHVKFFFLLLYDIFVNETYIAIWERRTCKWSNLINMHLLMNGWHSSSLLKQGIYNKVCAVLWIWLGSRLTGKSTRGIDKNIKNVLAWGLMNIAPI